MITSNNPEHLKKMVNCFNGEHYDIIVADNCSDLLLKSLRTKVQVVILDAALAPIGDRRPIGSRELVPILKNMHPNVKIVVFTENNSLQQEKDFRRLEIFYYQVGADQFSPLMSVVCAAFAHDASPSGN
jgi:DNA-binding NtrC family response regulator